MKRCDHCRCFYPHPPAQRPDEIVFSAEGTYGGGQCRRYPPRDEGEFNLARFRTVACDWWCDEFAPANGIPASHAGDMSPSLLTAGIPDVL